MNINQLNRSDAISHPVAPISVTQKKVMSDTDVASSPVSTGRPTVNNKSETVEQIKQAVQEIQEAADILGHNLRFSIDEETGKSIIKVLDAHTDEVIRQFPTEEAIEIARSLDKMQGLLLNDKA